MRVLAWSLLVLAGISTALLVWSNAHIAANPNAADASVSLANELGAPDFLYQEAYVSYGDASIHYVVAGQGEPIVFLHGFPSYWFTMFRLMEAFKSDHQVIAIDGLAAGKSSAPSAITPYQLSHLANHIGAVLDDLDLQRAHLVGHDWGAVTASAFAQAYPDRVISLTTIGALPHNIVLNRLANDDPHYQATYEYIDYFVSAHPLLLQAMGVRERIREDIYAPMVTLKQITAAEGQHLYKSIGDARRLNRFIHWYRANFPRKREVVEQDFWPNRHARITVPSLFVYGDSDPIVTPELVGDLQQASHKLRVVRLPDSGHRPHFERREKVITEIKALIKASRQVE